MVFCSSQIWFLSPQMFLSALYVFIIVTGWLESLLCVLSLFLLFLSGYFFDSLCFSLLRERGNGWTQLLYYIAELCLSYYYWINERSHHKRSSLLSIITSSSEFRSHIPIAYYNKIYPVIPNHLLWWREYLDFGHLRVPWYNCIKGPFNNRVFLNLGDGTR